MQDEEDRLKQWGARIVEAKRTNEEEVKSIKARNAKLIGARKGLQAKF